MSPTPTLDADRAAARHRTYALHADRWHAIRRERTRGDVTWCLLWLARSSDPNARVTGAPAGTACPECIRELEHVAGCPSANEAFDDDDVTADIVGVTGVTP